MNLASILKKGKFNGIAVKAIIFLLTTAVCMAVVHAWLNSTGETVSQSPADSAGLPLRPVTIAHIHPKEYRANIKAVGEVVPVWQTILRSQVGGAIVGISEKLKPGTTVSKGDILVTVDDTEYTARVAEAEGRLATAKVTLLKEKSEAEEALMNWKHSGLKGDPGSELVLRRPQLEAAQTEVKAAKSALHRAKKELCFTSIRAPFDGLVVMRHVNLGESIFAGDEVATIYGTEKAEIAVHLDASQWSLLPPDWKGIGATLRDPSQNATWEAIVVRDGGHLDRKSRLRALYLEVYNPYELNPALLPGTFVQVEICGQTLPHLLSIPESALTRKGYVWYLDEYDTLRRFKAKPVFYREGEVFLSPPKTAVFPLRVTISPTTNFAVGLKVTPITLKPDEQPGTIVSRLK